MRMLIYTQTASGHTHTHVSVQPVCVCVRLDQRRPQSHSRVCYITNERLSTMFTHRAFLYARVLIICLLPLLAAMDSLKTDATAGIAGGCMIAARFQGLGGGGCQSLSRYRVQQLSRLDQTRQGRGLSHRV